MAEKTANRRAGRFAPGSKEYTFFDQTLMLSTDAGVGHHFQPDSLVREDAQHAEHYELLARLVKPDGTLELAGTSRIRITNTSFFGGFKGPLVQTGAKRLAHGSNRISEGIGVVYLISLP